MPRNINIHLENYLHEGNFPLFVLLFAIENDIQVPNALLRRYGTQYGESFLVYESDFREASEQITKLIQRIRNFRSLTETEVDAILTDEHNARIKRHQRFLDIFNNSCIPIDNMIDTVKPLPAKTEFEVSFKSQLLEFLLDKKKHLEEELGVDSPLKHTSTEYLTDRKSDVKELWGKRRRYQRYVFQDPLNMEQIRQDWF